MKPLLGILLGAVIVALLALVRKAEECASVGERLRLVVTQVPAGSEAAASPDTAREALAFSRRYPSGSRVVLVEAGADGRGVVRILSEGLDAAGAPELSPLGDRVVFAGRRRPGSSWRIFEADLERGRAKLRVEVAGDCGDPVYLPGGELVLVVTERRGTSAAGELGYASYLARTSREAVGVERITFGPGAPSYPTVLHDGRLLFSMSTEAGALGRGAPQRSLFTVNPDGTLLDPFTGLHDGARSELRARQTEDGLVVFVSAPSMSGPRTLATVPFARPMGMRTELTVGVTGAGKERKALLALGSVEPLAAGRLVVTGRTSPPGAAGTSGVYLVLAGSEEAACLFDAPDWSEVEALPVVKRRRPRARPSSVAPAKRTGTLVCYDAGYSDGVYGPAKGAAEPALVSVQTSARDAVKAGYSDAWPLAAEPGIVELGPVHVAEDRSFFVRVPADVPLRVQSFDSGHELISTSGWFWVRPGETRACFGCHERRDTAPPNRIVQAIAEKPQELAAPMKELAQ